MAVIGDRSDGDNPYGCKTVTLSIGVGFKFDENSSVDLVVPATRLMPDDQLDRLADLIVTNHDAAFVICTTVSCYNFFLKAKPVNNTRISSVKFPCRFFTVLIKPRILAFL